MTGGPDMPSGRDRLGTRADDLLDREAGRLADHPRRTIARYLLTLFAVVFVLGALGTGIGFLSGWFNAGKQVFSPDNVRTQYAAVIGDYKALRAAAGNACEAKNAKPDPNSPTLIEAPDFAYDAQYRSIAVDYDRRQNNIFEAKLVGPKGYPRNAPTLTEMEGQVCR